MQNSGLWIVLLNDETISGLPAGLPVTQERRHRLSQMNTAAAELSVCAELLARRLAAQALGVRADHLELAAEPHGKPFFKEYPDFHFNISHASPALHSGCGNSRVRGAVAAAYAQVPVGVDIEHGGRKIDLRVPDRFFHPEERAHVRNGADPAQRALVLWTQKEALLKRDGCGIAGISQSMSVLAADDIATHHEMGYILSVCCTRDVGAVQAMSAGELMDYYR